MCKSSTDSCWDASTVTEALPLVYTIPRLEAPTINQVFCSPLERSLGRPHINIVSAGSRCISFYIKQGKTLYAASIIGSKLQVGAAQLWSLLRGTSSPKHIQQVLPGENRQKFICCDMYTIKFQVQGF